MSSSAPALAHSTGQEPHVGLTLRPGWRPVVEEFVKELVARGYSAYTIRDYRTDVVRLASWLDLAPHDLEPRHLMLADEVMARDGLDLAARRRRRSAYQRFLVFLDGQRIREPLAPGLLQKARMLPAGDRLLFGLTCLSGLRLVEISQIEGRDIRLRKGIITCRSGYRILPLHPALRALILEVRREHPLVAFRPILPGLNGYVLNGRTLHSRFHRAAAKLGFAGLRPDDLRREVSEFLMRLGTPPALVRAFLGKDRGRPVAPRHGRFLDLTCLADRVARIPV